MDDSLQQLLDAAEPEFPTQNAILLSTTAVGSGSDSAAELKLEAAMARRRPAPRGTAAYPRKRANRACQVCRARRTKCDNKKPSCSFCEKVGAKCITSPTDLSSYVPFLSFPLHMSCREVQCTPQTSDSRTDDDFQALILQASPS